MNTSPVSHSRSSYSYDTPSESFGERVLEKASALVPAPIRKVAYAVTLPIYMTVAFGSVGAVVGGTIGGLGGPLGLVAGAISGGSMAGSIGATLGAQLALASLADRR